MSELGNSSASKKSLVAALLATLALFLFSLLFSSDGLKGLKRMIADFDTYIVIFLVIAVVIYLIAFVFFSVEPRKKNIEADFDESDSNDILLKPGFPWRVPIAGGILGGLFASRFDGIILGAAAAFIGAGAIVGFIVAFVGRYRR